MKKLLIIAIFLCLIQGVLGQHVDSKRLEKVIMEKVKQREAQNRINEERERQEKERTREQVQKQIQSTQKSIQYQQGITAANFRVGSEEFKKNNEHQTCGTNMNLPKRQFAEPRSYPHSWPKVNPRQSIHHLRYDSRSARGSSNHFKPTVKTFKRPEKANKTKVTYVPKLVKVETMDYKKRGNESQMSFRGSENSDYSNNATNNAPPVRKSKNNTRGEKEINSLTNYDYDPPTTVQLPPTTGESPVPEKTSFVPESEKKESTDNAQLNEAYSETNGLTSSAKAGQAPKGVEQNTTQFDLQKEKAYVAKEVREWAKNIPVVEGEINSSPVVNRNGKTPKDELAHLAADSAKRAEYISEMLKGFNVQRR